MEWTIQSRSSDVIPNSEFAEFLVECITKTMEVDRYDVENPMRIHGWQSITKLNGGSNHLMTLMFKYGFHINLIKINGIKLRLRKFNGNDHQLYVNGLLVGVL